MDGVLVGSSSSENVPPQCTYDTGTNNSLPDLREQHQVDKRKILETSVCSSVASGLNCSLTQGLFLSLINDNFVLIDMLLDKESSVWLFNFYFLEVFRIHRVP